MKHHESPEQKSSWEHQVALAEKALEPIAADTSDEHARSVVGAALERILARRRP